MASKKRNKLSKRKISSLKTNRFDSESEALLHVIENKSADNEMSNLQKYINESKITTKDIRDSLWGCRDFELSHLWQRSVFLTTMLVLCFTGYGVVLINLCEQVEKGIGISIYVLNNIALVLCIVNIVFSTLWIMMAKGSKAWYERYERAIDAFECDEKYAKKEVVKSGVNDTSIGGFQYQNLQGYERPDVRDCIFSCKGGGYSPSKINIAIGQISFILWCSAFVVHFFLSYIEFRLEESWIKTGIPFFLLFVFLILIRIIIISIDPRFNGKWIKSSELHNFRGISKPINIKNKKPYRYSTVYYLIRWYRHCRLRYRKGSSRTHA